MVKTEINREALQSQFFSLDMPELVQIRKLLNSVIDAKRQAKGKATMEFVNEGDEVAVVRGGEVELVGTLVDKKRTNVVVRDSKGQRYRVPAWMVVPREKAVA